MREYDVVTIGTSPGTIFEMATFQSKGLKTLMIDSAEDYGGAWGTFNSPQFGKIDIGPHLFSPLPGLSKFYSEILGLSLKSTVPNPKYIMPRKVFGSNQTELKNRWGAGVRVVDNFPFDLKSWRAFASPYYRILRGVFRSKQKKDDDLGYVQINGSNLTSYLKKFAINKGLEVSFKQFVEKVSIDTKNNRVTITTNQGQVITKQFMLTSCAILNSIHLDGEVIDIQSEPNSLNHIHFVLRGSTVNKFSIGVISKSSNIRLVGNQTPFLSQEYTDAGYSLVSALLTTDVPLIDSNKIIIFDEIKGYGILNNDNTLEGAYWVPHDTPQRQDDELSKIRNQLSPFVITLATHSFHRLMEHRLDLWYDALNSK